MLSITRPFDRRTLTTIGLLRFVYGIPEHHQLRDRRIASGVAVGFLLAVGRDVGAARWIFEWV